MDSEAGRRQTRVTRTLGLEVALTVAFESDLRIAAGDRCPHRARCRKVPRTTSGSRPSPPAGAFR